MAAPARASAAAGSRPAEMGREPGQPGAEGKRLHPPAGRRHRLQEHHQRPRVGLHRPGHVAQEDELAGDHLGPPPGPLQWNALRSEARHEASVAGRARRRPSRLEAPRAAHRLHPRQPRDHAPHRPQLIRGHRREVALPQELGRRVDRRRQQLLIGSSCPGAPGRRPPPGRKRRPSSPAAPPPAPAPRRPRRRRRRAGCRRGGRRACSEARGRPARGRSGRRRPGRAARPPAGPGRPRRPTRRSTRPKPTSLPTTAPPGLLTGPAMGQQRPRRPGREPAPGPRGP